LPLYQKVEGGRFLYSHSPSSALQQPTISNILFQNGFCPGYPEGRSFGVCISHDIDILHQSKSALIDKVKTPIRELREGSFKRAFQSLNPKSPVNPYWNIDKILDFEQEHGVVASFYFLSLLPSEQDFNYSVDSIDSFFQAIRHAGAEIGLHGGHTAYKSLDKLSRELDHLQSHAKISIKGYRNHFLRFDINTTWKILGELDFDYDTTYGFADMPGFRNGMCYPFHPFDFDHNQELNILELPLIAMDASYVYYLKWTPCQALEHLKKLVDAVKHVNGVFTLLWHNNLMVGAWGDVFEQITFYCKRHDAWFASGSQLCAWWRQNGYAKQYSEILNVSS